MCVGPVTDDEVLHRSVRYEYVVYDGTSWRLSNQAFNDTEWKPSVDRKSLRDDPRDTQISATDGVAQLEALQVRAIAGLVNNPGAAQTERITLKVDVIARPIESGNPSGLPENRSHAQIETDPSFANGNRFNKLKDALCRIAESHGWAIEPYRQS